MTHEPGHPRAPFTHYPSALAGLSVHDLSGSIEWGRRALRIYGREVYAPRLIAMYGRAYAYSGTSHPTRDIPEALEVVRVRVEAITGCRFNSVLCNLYRDGSDSVGWHSDDDYNPGRHPEVASVSLGSTRRFRVRTKRREGRESISWDLAHGDLLVMGPTAQDLWQHCVTKTTKPVGERVNLTFRWIE